MNKQIVLGILVGMMASGTLSLAASAPNNKLSNNNLIVAQNSEDAPSHSPQETVNKKKKKVKSATHKKTAATQSKPVAKKATAAVAAKQGAVKQGSKPVAIKPVTKGTITAKKLYTTPLAQNPTTATSATSSTSDTTPAVKSINAPSVTSTPIANATSSVKKSPFGFKYRSYNAMDLATLEGDTGHGSLTNANGSPMLDTELRAWDRFNFSYALNENISFDIMPQLYHTWFGNRDRMQDPTMPGLQQPYASYIGDTGLYFADSKLATLAGGINLDFVQAYFLPTSEASQDAGTIGVTRTNFGFGRSFGPFDIKWTESLWYYFQQTQTSSLVRTTNGLPVQNIQYRVWSLLDLGLNMTKKFAVTLEAGFMNQLQYADDNAATARPAVLQDNIVLDPEVSYAFSDHFSLALGIWELYDMRSASQPYYSPLSSANGSEGYFQTTVKF